MPLTTQQQIVYVRVSNGTLLTAAERLHAHLETVPPARIVSFESSTPTFKTPFETSAHEVMFVIEFVVPINRDDPFPAVIIA